MMNGKFVEAIEAAYKSATHPAQWPVALKLIADCFDDKGAILIFKKPDGSTAIIVSPGMERLMYDYNEGWWRHDFRLHRSFERGYIANLDTITDRHVVSMEETETHPFYRDFLAAYGLKWFVGTTVWPEINGWAGVAIERAIDKEPFTDDELVQFTRIARHVENALRLGIRLINAEAKSTSLADALGSLNIGIFLIEPSGRANPVNAIARGLLGDGLALRHGRLVARYEEEQRSLANAISRSLELTANTMPLEPRPIIIHGLDRDAFLAIYILPVTHGPGMLLEDYLTDVKALILAIPSHAGAAPNPSLVRDLLGVTLGEARVAALIGTGLSPKEIGTQLNISEETVRTTLKRVYQKTGTSRQSQLTGLLTRLAVGAGSQV